MFPIGDENNGQRLRPFINWSLLALNVLVFLYELTLSQQQLFDLFTSWGVVPADVSDGNNLISLITATFLHGGWLHLASNMLFLWVFGDNIEDVMGHVGYLVFYLSAGVLASVVQIVASPESLVPLVGASGAISGVMAAYVVLFPRGLIRTVIFLWVIPFFIMIPAWVQIGIWFFTQFVNGFVSLGVTTRETGGGGVAYFAHIGGFIAGLVLVWLFRNRQAHQRQLAAREHFRAFERYRTMRHQQAK